MLIRSNGAERNLNTLTGFVAASAGLAPMVLTTALGARHSPRPAGNGTAGQAGRQAGRRTGQHPTSAGTKDLREFGYCAEKNPDRQTCTVRRAK